MNRIIVEILVWIIKDEEEERRVEITVAKTGVDEAWEDLHLRWFHRPMMKSR
ncbi:MAG: hypothetical protein VYB60_09995 [SAR324 cluster bacterium]|nr:hypothetical protein [SAR324 cluster bacterium]